MLRHFLDDFMSFVPLQMPQLLNVATMEEPQFYGDYVLLTFPLRDPYDLEEVIKGVRSDWRNPVIAPVPTPIPLSGRCSR